MEPVDLETMLDSSDDLVEGWRLHCLLLAGCDVEPAQRIARDGEIDLHQAIAMLERGCPGELAVSILT